MDAVAELLIFEVDAFGIDCAPENRTIRKLVASTLTNLTFGNSQSKRRLCSHPNLIEYVIRIIDDSHTLAQNRTIRKLVASTLTNLTFGNSQSKRRLCSHPNLIEYVIRIIDDSHTLAQVYAGLLRNLSWMADAEMSAILAPSVSALARASLRAYRVAESKSLARASLRAYRVAESKCLCATLSALWNLASHSRDNKKAICEEPGFLEMLIELLTSDAQQTVLVEPASGVLKYASMYLAVVGSDRYLSSSALRLLIHRLVELLNSPSFTIIGNVLGVFSQLLAKDHQLRSLVLLVHFQIII
ncbi:unnamed protein product [Gongylonema pulchrum]|uniref:Uncharacterized protein n=1 Tax=Gongylonema pulchrum TaxID=637853 RepID=A0A3P7R6N2_9BILA|nr:unnamed protein product [Gongylonema pulchrum]